MFTIKYNRATNHIDGIAIRTRGGGTVVGGYVSEYSASACGALTRGYFADGKSFESLAEALEAAKKGTRKLCKTCEKAANAQLAAEAAEVENETKVEAPEVEAPKVETPKVEKETEEAPVITEAAVTVDMTSPTSGIIVSGNHSARLGRFDNGPWWVSDHDTEAQVGAGRTAENAVKSFTRHYGITGKVTFHRLY